MVTGGRVCDHIIFVINGVLSFDNDNEAWSRCNCAAKYGGGNWWGNWGYQNINGKYGGNRDSSSEFMYYFNSNEMALKSMPLMFRQAV